MSARSYKQGPWGLEILWGKRLTLAKTAIISSEEVYLSNCLNLCRSGFVSFLLTYSTDQGSLEEIGFDRFSDKLAPLPLSSRMNINLMKILIKNPINLAHRNAAHTVLNEALEFYNKQSSTVWILFSKISHTISKLETRITFIETFWVTIKHFDRFRL